MNCNLSTLILMNMQQKDKVFEKSNCNELTIIIPSSCTVLFINWSQSTIERRSVSLPPFCSLASFSYSALSRFAKCIQNSLYSSFRSNVKWELYSLWHERVLFAFHILQPLRTQTSLFFFWLSGFAEQRSKGNLSVSVSLQTIEARLLTTV